MRDRGSKSEDDSVSVEKATIVMRFARAEYNSLISLLFSFPSRVRFMDMDTIRQSSLVLSYIYRLFYRKYKTVPEFQEPL